jgi:hypothetical protein
VEDCDGVETAEVEDVTGERRRLGGGVVRRGLLGGALFLAFLYTVSTKLDFTDRATEDSVAQSRRLRSAGEGVQVLPGEEEERRVLRCTTVIFVFCKCAQGVGFV